MTINFFKHSDLPSINEQLGALTRNLRMGDTIKAIHTPIVLPLNTGDEIGGYARSLDFLFKKYIAIDCNRFLKETPAMQKFILARQIALFDKFSRCLHLPIAAVASVIAYLASIILFASPFIAALTFPAVGLASAVIIGKRERENEKYADLQAFRKCNEDEKREIINQMQKRLIKHKQSTFSSYPSYNDRIDYLENQFGVK